MSADHEPIVLGPITATFSVTAEDSNGTATMMRCDVAAGSGVPLAHSHDGFEETIYGLLGTTTFTVDGTDIVVNPGDTLCIKRGEIHSFMAHDGDVAFLAIATPGVFGPAYFRELAAVVRAAGGGRPDPAAMAGVMRRHGLTPVAPATAS
jgi:quercetin dioxygenase-like cupin family protein